MEKGIIETSAGFVGVGWTGGGVLFLNLPEPNAYEAELKIQYELEDLERKGCLKPVGNGGKVDIKSLEGAIKDFFNGIRVDLNFPVDWSPYTEFQRRVLQKVSLIPWGKVASYGDIAAAVGNPRGARAVGGAVGSNRVLLVVPCHRVIAHDGSIGGFGSGLDWKRKLLKIEGIDLGITPHP